MDVDGTLTDGKIYMSNQGELFKAFDVKDGCGIKDLLPKVDIIPIILTARESKLLMNRCDELNIVNVFQGIRDKNNKLKEIIEDYNMKNNTSYTYKNVAYIGDDILDIQCMQPIKEAGGFIGCPSDAVKEIIELSDFISSKSGGNGAVREFIEYIIGEQLFEN